MEKNSKGTNVLLAFGWILLVAGYYSCFTFLWNIIEYFTLGSDLSTGLGVAFGLILFWIPAVVLSVLAFIFNVIAFKKAIKPRSFWRKLPFVLSIILPVICLGEYIATHFI